MYTYNKTFSSSHRTHYSYSNSNVWNPIWCQWILLICSWEFKATHPPNATPSRVSKASLGDGLIFWRGTLKFCKISHMISHDIARYFMIYHYDTVYFSKFPTQWRTHTFCSFLRLLHHSFLPRQLFFGTKESPIWEIMDGLPEVYFCIMVVYGSRTQRYRYNDTYLQNCYGGSISQNHCPIYYVCTWYRIVGFKQISIKRESQEVVCLASFMHNQSLPCHKTSIITIHNHPS